MQKALVQESVVQALSKPNNLPETTVVNSGGRSVVLRSYDNAHWAALKWVSGIIDGGGDELKQLNGLEADKLADIRRRCVFYCLQFEYTSIQNLFGFEKLPFQFFTFQGTKSWTEGSSSSVHFTAVIQVAQQCSTRQVVAFM